MYSCLNLASLFFYSKHLIAINSLLLVNFVFLLSLSYLWFSPPTFWYATFILSQGCYGDKSFLCTLEASSKFFSFVFIVFFFIYFLFCLVFLNSEGELWGFVMNSCITCLFWSKSSQHVTFISIHLHILFHVFVSSLHSFFHFFSFILFIPFPVSLLFVNRCSFYLTLALPLQPSFKENVQSRNFQRHSLFRSVRVFCGVQLALSLGGREEQWVERRKMQFRRVKK